MPATPFASHVDRYLDAGWPGVLPLPARAKKSPPKGYTGKDGAYPTVVELDGWRRTDGAGNIALRMPPTVIGIDVDAYGDKPGATTLTDLEADLGPLPPTWVSTSRTDGVSGIRFYRLPHPVQLIGSLPGIEIVQRHHRYAVVAPSIHPEGRAYYWVTPEGEIGDIVPPIDDIPLLPDAWVDHLREASRNPAQKRAVATGGDVSPAVDRALGSALRGLRHGTRHDAALQGAVALTRLAHLGHPGAAQALEDLGQSFTSAISQDRATPPEADKEWRDIVDGAEDLVASTPSIAPAWEERRHQATPGAIVLDDRPERAADGATVDEPWPEPTGLPEADPMPEVPVDALPAWVADQVGNVTRQLMCDPMLPFMFGLGALSVASLGHVRVHVRRGEVMRSTGVYIAAAGPPASGKSPALDFMIDPVREVESEAIHHAEAEVAKAAARRKIAAKEADTALELAARTGSPDDKRSAENLAADAASHIDPPTGELITTDITPERLATLMAANAERAAVVSDESGVLNVDRYADRGNAKKLDIYLQSFTGQKVAVHRQKAPTVRLTKPLLAIVAGVQPEALAGAMADEEWRTRGMGSRFLTATTDVLAANTDIDLDVWDQTIGDTYNATLGRLARRWGSWGQPLDLHIEPAARRLFSEWAGTIRGRERAGGDLHGEGGWASKMRTSVLRIAALLHLADEAPDGSGISGDAMGRAIRIGEWFIVHHVREAGVGDSDAAKLLGWLIRKTEEIEADVARDTCATRPFVARREVARGGPRGLRTKEQMALPLTDLYLAGLIRFPGETNGQVKDLIERAKLIEVHPDAAEWLACATPRDTARQTQGENIETTRERDECRNVAHVAYRGFPTPLPSDSPDSPTPPPCDTRDMCDKPPDEHPTPPVDNPDDDDDDEGSLL